MKTPARRRALIIDNEENSLKSLEVYFRGRNWDVFCTASAKEGVSLALREQPTLIMLDNLLPGIMGLQTLVELGRVSKAPLLLMTNKRDEELEFDARTLGARAVLTKPVQPPELEQAITYALDGV